MDCVSCKSTIADDSFYCDQCGTELLRCTGCGRLGEKKRCIYCGKPLVAIRAADAGQTAAMAVGIMGPTAAQSASGGIGIAGGGGVDSTHAATAASNGGMGTVTSAASAFAVEPAIGHLRLSNAQHGIDINAADGDVLGRRFGPHVGVFGRFSQISSNHLQVKRAADGSWRVIDLDSFNCTFYNGMRLTPRREQPVAGGGVLALADIELRITIS